jgi:hypothetical protein
LFSVFASDDETDTHAAGTISQSHVDVKSTNNENKDKDVDKTQSPLTNTKSDSAAALLADDQSDGDDMEQSDEDVV